MANLIDLILNSFPASNDVGVPLNSALSFTLSGLNYDTTSLEEGLFLEGPDTDQFVGPGLAILNHPNGVSQGNIDDFLQSPGYSGIVLGEITVTGISGNTVVSFSPDLPLAALTNYVLNLTYVLELDGVTDVTGHVTVPFLTGSGSIEVLPSTASTSVLAQSSLSPLLDTSSLPFTITSVTPKDHSVQNPVSTREIVVEFSKNIDPLSVDSNAIAVETIPATDHPNIVIQANGELAKQVTVEGNKLKIKI
jgi:hypothetical protein